VRILTSVRDRAFENRVTRWAMVTITADAPFDTPTQVQRLNDFVALLYPQLLAAREGRAAATSSTEIP
jgi:hypothetical protein